MTIVFLFKFSCIYAFPGGDWYIGPLKQLGTSKASLHGHSTDVDCPEEIGNAWNFVKKSGKKEWRKAKDDATVVEYEPSKYSRDQYCCIVHTGPGSRR